MFVDNNKGNDDPLPVAVNDEDIVAGDVYVGVRITLPDSAMMRRPGTDAKAWSSTCMEAEETRITIFRVSSVNCFNVSKRTFEGEEKGRWYEDIVDPLIDDLLDVRIERSFPSSSWVGITDLLDSLFFVESVF